jgi:hypothetical protein
MKLQFILPLYSLFLSSIHSSRQLRPTIILGWPGNPFPALSPHVIFTRSWDGPQRVCSDSLNLVLASHKRGTQSSAAGPSQTTRWSIKNSRGGQAAVLLAQDERPHQGHGRRMQEMPILQIIQTEARTDPANSIQGFGPNGRGRSRPQRGRKVALPDRRRPTLWIPACAKTHIANIRVQRVFRREKSRKLARSTPSSQCRCCHRRKRRKSHRRQKRRRSSPDCQDGSRSPCQPAR